MAELGGTSGGACRKPVLSQSRPGLPEDGAPVPWGTMQGCPRDPRSPPPRAHDGTQLACEQRPWRKEVEQQQQPAVLPPVPATSPGEQGEAPGCHPGPHSPAPRLFPPRVSSGVFAASESICPNMAVTVATPLPALPDKNGSVCVLPALPRGWHPQRGATALLQDAAAFPRHRACTPAEQVLSPSPYSQCARPPSSPSLAPCRSQPCCEVRGALRVPFLLAFAAVGLLAPGFVGSCPTLHRRSPGKMLGVFPTPGSTAKGDLRRAQGGTVKRPQWS